MIQLTYQAFIEKYWVVAVDILHSQKELNHFYLPAMFISLC